MLNDLGDYNDYRQTYSYPQYSYPRWDSDYFKEMDQYSYPGKLPKDGDYWEELGECDEEDCEEKECPYKKKERKND